jgi:hypothetical protein
MNKLVAGAVAGLTLGMLSMASAQVAVSVGGGLQYGYDIVGQGVQADYESYYGTRGNFSYTFGVPASYYGLNLFLDATFVQVAVDLGFGGGKLKEELLYEGNSYPLYGGTTNVNFNFTNIGISLLGKYNIPIRDGMEAFPAVGVEYDLCLSAQVKGYPDGNGGITTSYTSYKDDAGNDAPGHFSQFAIKLGVGYDYAINEKLFCRVLALYGLGFPTKFSSDTESTLAAEAALRGETSDYEAAYSQNITVKVSIGFKL